MPETGQGLQPQVVVETEGLSREEWLAYRRSGIGGSDAAAVLGISPFATARDLYYDKLGIAPVEDDEHNWVALKIGHLLEDLVAEIFSRKTGYRAYQIKKMFRHPYHTFMLADVDYFVELPDGTTAILEIKTTNWEARAKWWDGAREIVPANYEAQGRHYMAVTNLNTVFFCCLYGNNEDHVVIRRIDRDMAYETELIALEGDFVVNHIAAQVPPPYTENGDLVLESTRRHYGPADADAPALMLGEDYTDSVSEYLELQRQKSDLDRQSRELESRMKRIKGDFADTLGRACSASCASGGVTYIISYSPVRRTDISKDNLARLRLNLPDVYGEYVTTSESRRFSIKPMPGEEAAA